MDDERDNRVGSEDCENVDISGRILGLNLLQLI